MFVDKAIMFFIYLSSGFLPPESPLSERCNIVVSERILGQLCDLLVGVCDCRSWWRALARFAGAGERAPNAPKMYILTLHDHRNTL